VRIGNLSPITNHQPDYGSCSFGLPHKFRLDGAAVGKTRNSGTFCSSKKGNT
jgi:hypothetical protein